MDTALTPRSTRANAWSLALIAIVIAGCKPTALIGSPGQITLSYDGASYSEVHLVIQNRSGREISFLASKFFAEDAEPWGTLIFCAQPHGENSIGYFPPLDYDFHPVNVSLRSEERLRVSYPKRVLNMKGTCHLELKLSDDSVIRSDDFKV